MANFKISEFELWWSVLPLVHEWLARITNYCVLRVITKILTLFPNHSEFYSLYTFHTQFTPHPLTDPGAGIFLWINFLLYITCNNYTYAGVGTDIMHAMLTHFTQLTPHYSLHSSQKNYTLCTVHCTLHTTHYTYINKHKDTYGLKN